MMQDQNGPLKSVLDSATRELNAEGVRKFAPPSVRNPTAHNPLQLIAEQIERLTFGQMHEMATGISERMIDRSTDTKTPSPDEVAHVPHKWALSEVEPQE